MSKQIKALIEVRVRPQKSKGFDAMARRIAKHDAVTDVLLLSGEFDLLITVEGTSLEEISNFVSDKLASIEHVQSTVTHFILKTYKEHGELTEEDADVDRLVVSL